MRATACWHYLRLKPMWALFRVSLRIEEKKRNQPLACWYHSLRLDWNVCLFCFSFFLSAFPQTLFSACIRVTKQESLEERPRNIWHRFAWMAGRTFLKYCRKRSRFKNLQQCERRKIGHIVSELLTETLSNHRIIHKKEDSKCAAITLWLHLMSGTHSCSRRRNAVNFGLMSLRPLYNTVNWLL